MFDERKVGRYIAPMAAGFAFAVGVAACGGKSLETSPAAISPIYPGDPNAHGRNPFNWHEVVLADIEVPTDTREVIASFENPPGSGQCRESNPMKSASVGKLLLRVGPGAVRFRIISQGDKGSQATEVAPTVKWEGPEPYNKAIAEPNVHVPPGWQPKDVKCPS